MSSLFITKISRGSGSLIRIAGYVAGRTGIASLTLHMVLGAPAALFAGTTGATVTSGSATVGTRGGTTTIDQKTRNAIIRWHDFGNAPGETIRFNQPDAASSTLNRVTGGRPSEILGNLSANGRVYVINPRGVLVGPQGRIDTNGFIASTRDIDDAAFLAGGDLRFTGDSDGDVTNLGVISGGAGDVLLVARTVVNRGVVEAPGGLAGFAAGTDVLFKATGADRIFILSGAGGAKAAAGVDNSGVVNAAQAELKAAGGNAYALAVNNGGAVSATGIAMKNGRVVLTAEGGSVAVSGKLSAKNTDGSGGEILVGGDVRGSNAANVPRAASVTLAKSALIAADGAVGKNGGSVVVWSDGVTRFDGRISATGVTGGFAEVSGKTLAVTGAADLRGSSGRAGELLLDPTDLVIDGSPTPYDPGAAGASVVGAAWIADQLALASIHLTADASITGNAGTAIAWSTPNTLTLQAPNLALHGLISGTDAASAIVLRSATGGVVAVDGSLRAGTLAIRGGMSVLVSGVVTADRVTYAATTPGRESFIMDNPANSFARILINDGEGSTPVTFDSAVSIRSNRSLVLGDGTLGFSGSFTTAGNNVPVSIVAGGDLILESEHVFLGAGTSTLSLVANGGQFVNPHGGLLGGSRIRIWSTSSGTYNGTAFDDGGLTGFATVRGVDYGVDTDPASAKVFYFRNRLLTITALDASKIYGEANPTFSANYAGFGPGDSSSLVTGLTFSAPAGASDAGTYAGAIVPAGASAPHYDITYQPGTLTVTKAALFVTANSVSRTYGDANPTTTILYSGLKYGQTGDTVVGAAASTSATTVSPVGAYAIVASGPAATTNYTVTYVPGSLTVTPAPLTLVVDNASRAYGDANPGFTGTVTGFVNGDTPSAVNGVTYATSATVGSHVGTYAVSASGGAPENGNYAVVHRIPGTLTINPADLFISGGYLSREYGAPNPVFSGTVTGGLKNGDTFDLSQVMFSTGATATSGVGTYAVTGSTGFVGDYRPVISGGTLEITPARLTVTADAVTRAYGDPFALTYTVSGMKNDDAAPSVSVGLSPEANAASPIVRDVGSYRVNAAGQTATGNPNYVVGAYLPGSLTIVPLQIELTPDAASRLYGDNNPAILTGAYRTLNSVDNRQGPVASLPVPSGSLVLESAASRTSDVGDYAITGRIAGVGSGNYALSLAPGAGLLSVTPAPLTLTPYIEVSSSTVSARDLGQTWDTSIRTTVTAGYAPDGTSHTVVVDSRENRGGTILYVRTTYKLDPSRRIGVESGGVRYSSDNGVTFTSTDGVNYTTPRGFGSPDAPGTRGTILIDESRRIVVTDRLPSVKLAAQGLRNNDAVNYQYTVPAMPGAGDYELTVPTLDANSVRNYAVTLNTPAPGALGYRLERTAVRLTLPDIAIPINLFLPDEFDAGFKIAGDLTVADFKRIYMHGIDTGGVTKDAIDDFARGGVMVSSTSGSAPVRVPAPPYGGTPVVYVTPSTIQLTGVSEKPIPASSVPAGLSAVESLPGFTDVRPGFLSAPIAKAGLELRLGKTEFLANFYEISPLFLFLDSPYFTRIPEYATALRVVDGQTSVGPKNWSRLTVLPALTPPLPPDSQSSAQGIAAARAAAAAADAAKPSLGATLNTVNVTSESEINKLDGMASVRPAVNAFGLTSASDDFLGSALYMWAVDNGLPVPRGAASPADVARWYSAALAAPDGRAQIAGYLTTMLLTILVKPEGDRSGPEKAFVSDINNFIEQKRIDSYNAGLAAFAKWQAEDTASRRESSNRIKGTTLTVLDTGTNMGGGISAPKYMLSDAANWMSGISADDHSLAISADAFAGTMTGVASAFSGGVTTGVSVASRNLSASGTVISKVFPHLGNALDKVDDAGNLISKSTIGLGRSAGIIGGVANGVGLVVSSVVSVMQPLIERAALADGFDNIKNDIRNKPISVQSLVDLNNPYPPGTDAHMRREANNFQGVCTILAVMNSMMIPSNNY